ncbi:hypothetical protein [Parvicella tangerina]|uniref:Uncharacterized protein n=1 Tax=Parvicella tangerina TaxID=2829795 RepID=A0A916JKA9_9FLAO|nr:hypothetical protein [Parvicella tangerina]CAG5078678.1 hypothetical protein CRYO30217_00738 [Parvicella tangerina]
MKINACNEDWSKMTPNQEGRHCDICNLTVIPLGDKNLEEIESLKEEKGKVCGRVSKAQLAEFRYLHPMKRFAIALFLVFGTGLFTTSYAQVLTESEIQVHQEHEYTIKFRAINTDGTALKGVYINFDTFSEYQEGSTDKNGELVLKFSDTATTRTVHVNISYGNIFASVNFKAVSETINNFDRIIFDPEKHSLTIGKLEFEEMMIMGDVAPIDWQEDPAYEQKTEHN